MPTDTADLLPLADECERAGEGSAELDGLIFAWQQGRRPDEINKLISGPDDHSLAIDGRWTKAPRFTRSIDAALSLKPEGWRLETLSQRYAHGKEPYVHCTIRRVIPLGIHMADGSDYADADAASSPLAACAASLRAHHAAAADDGEAGR